MVLEYLQAALQAAEQWLARTEDFVKARQWDLAMESQEHFVDGLLVQLAMEDKLLFPALENMSGSPLQAAAQMASEHAELRELTGRMQAALQHQDELAYLEQAVKLRLHLRAHLQRERALLGTMALGLLTEEDEDLTQRLRELHDDLLHDLEPELA